MAETASAGELVEQFDLVDGRLLLGHVIFEMIELGPSAIVIPLAKEVHAGCYGTGGKMVLQSFAMLTMVHASRLPMSVIRSLSANV